MFSVDTQLVEMPGFEPGVTCTQNRHVSRYTTSRKQKDSSIFQKKNPESFHLF